MTALLFDTEATGTEDTDQIIEAAHAPVWFTGAYPTLVLESGNLVTERFRPTVPIKYGAMAVHHILPEDLVDRPPSPTFRLPADTTYLIGHNIDFDWRMAGSPPEVKRICTLALARLLWPTLDSHKQSAIMYHLLGPSPRTRAVLQNAHSATADVMMLAILLERMVGELTVRRELRSMEHLWEISEDARVPEFITFGKWKAAPGEPPRKFADVPIDYREWMLRQKDMDPYVLTAVRRSMGRA